MDIFEHMVWGNSLWAWTIALLVAAGASAVLFFVRSRGGRRLARLAADTDTQLDDLAAEFAQGIHVITIVILAMYVGAQFVALPDILVRVVRSVTVIILCLQGAWWGNQLIKSWITRSQEEPKDGERQGPSLTAIAFFMRLALYSLVALVMLDNLGVDITVLMAGLGVGGIAVALATQNILGDVFCSIAILLDKPFEVGDFIIVGEFLGVVEHIGVKTTRVRSLQGEMIVFSNVDLVGSRIRNYKHMRERRIVFAFGVVYQTPADKLDTIPGMVRGIIDSQDLARCDRVHFHKFGDSSLDFEVVYYVDTGDYTLYMDTQQAINLAIFRAFEEQVIEFAYPTRTLYVAEESAEAAAAP